MQSHADAAPAQSPSRSAFGDFLRSRREKLNPTAMGLANLQRRRTPGLRRQEVAELAGIGVDWYIRLEQGRATCPSTATIDALARALHLTKAEHTHLRTLAHGTGRRAFVREAVPATIQRLVHSLNQPAYVTGRRWDMLAWNGAAASLFRHFTGAAEADRNILLFMFTDPEAKCLFGQAWAEEARRMVAQFRTTHDVWAGDPAFTALVERLGQGSPEFDAWWTSHDVQNSGTGRKTLHHPQDGTLHFEYSTFQANDDPALKLAIYTLCAGPD